MFLSLSYFWMLIAVFFDLLPSDSVHFVDDAHRWVMVSFLLYVTACKDMLRNRVGRSLYRILMTYRFHAYDLTLIQLVRNCCIIERLKVLWAVLYRINLILFIGFELWIRLQFTTMILDCNKNMSECTERGRSAVRRAKTVCFWLPPSL